MQILVINASPKGRYSITLKTAEYLQKVFPDDTFTILHAGQRIAALKKDFSPALAAMAQADLVLFCYPVYTFLAPSQLHEFIALCKQHGAPLAGKMAAQITTSKHFYDMTAHRYVRENCEDLGLRYVDGLSADMEDLLSEKGRKQAADFWRYVRWCAQNGQFAPAITKEYAHKSVWPTAAQAVPHEAGDVVIVTDAQENTPLAAMIERFRAVLPEKTRVVNLHEIALDGGCLGCFRCAASGQCIYKDRFDDFLRNEIQRAQATVYAFTVRDHSMGPLFKRYDDRQFCNGHRTVTMGSPVGYLVSGGLAHEENLRTVLEARAQVGGNFYAGAATDETDPDGAIDALAGRLHYALQNAYTPPSNFYGAGGMRIFRDLIWQMQGLMRADHKFFKSHGQYDFPQKKRGKMLAMYLVGALMGSEKLTAKMGNKMNEGMIAPYEKVLKNIR